MNGKTMSGKIKASLTPFVQWTRGRGTTVLAGLKWSIAGLALIAGNAALAAANPESLPSISGQSSFFPGEPATRQKNDLDDPAPFDDTPHFGNIGGIKIAIPRKYWASASTQTDTSQESCKDGASGEDKFRCRIKVISLALRDASSEGIYTVRDLMDWTKYHNTPPDRVALSHRWIEIGFDADMFEQVQGDLAKLYRNHIEEARQHFGEFVCDKKFGMERCTTSKREKIQAVPNEFYFDRAHGKVLIECVRYEDTAGLGFNLCSQYYPVPEIKAVAAVMSFTDEENSRWESRLGQIRRIANLLIAK